MSAALRRILAGLALGAMAALWWWAFAGLGEPRVVGPGHERAGAVIARAPFGREMYAIEPDGTGSRRNQTWLAGWALLLGGESALALTAAWALGVRPLPVLSAPGERPHPY
jgi:hypothetical protein